MKMLRSGKFAALFALLASTSLAQAQTANWQKDWEETVAAAKKEGTVVVLGQPSPAMRNEILPKFTERYGIKVELIAGQSSTTVGKVRTERAAGIYSVDVFMSNGGTSISVLYAEKMIDPLKPMLILPEVTDPSKWKGGVIPFADPEKQYLLLMFRSVDSHMVVNQDYVKPEEMRHVKDLLNPKWKGKIATEDPAAGRRRRRRQRRAFLHPDRPGIRQAALYRPAGHRAARPASAERLARARQRTDLPDLPHRRHARAGERRLQACGAL